MRSSAYGVHSLLAIILPVAVNVCVAGKREDGSILVDHSYYKMELYSNNAQGTFDRYVVNMKGSRVHDFLSNHSQAAEAVAPGFEFPFYGHMVDQFFITTHGFLSFAPRLHNLMYKTQYIAPLRKRDPGLSFDWVKYRLLIQR